MEVWAGSCVKQALEVHSTSVVRFEQVCYMWRTNNFNAHASHTAHKQDARLTPSLTAVAL